MRARYRDEQATRNRCSETEVSLTGYVVAMGEATNPAADWVEFDLQTG
jgi:hypothetical protein